MTAFAVTKESGGSDVMSMKLRAKKNGDRFVLNGTMPFITNGPVADVLLVFAKKNSEKKKTPGITAFVVEKVFNGKEKRSELQRLRRLAETASEASAIPPLRFPTS